MRQKSILLSHAAAVFAVTLAVTAYGKDKAPQPEATHTPPPANRIASVFISEDFINEQLAAHSHSELIKNMKIALDTDRGQIDLKGHIQVPIEELRAVNLDPKLGEFIFQVAIKPDTTKHGHLILEFPLTQTYFYPASSKNPKEERVVIPTQMLSVALASVRGYLAALSGDFSGFDKREAKLKVTIAGLEHTIKHEKDQAVIEEAKNQLEAAKLQLAAVPVERKQLESVAKSVEHILGFTGEKELNLNQELGARKNALVLKIKLAQMVPYLADIELGGTRIVHDKKDGNGENYLAIDLNSTVDTSHPPSVVTPSNRPGMAQAPLIIMRLNQALFESSAMGDAEKKEMGESLRNFSLALKDDGLHVSGEWHKLILNIPFDTVVDFKSTGVDVFEARLRELKVAGLDLEFLSKFVLESLKRRLNHALKGLCKFKYVGEESDKSRALQVSVDPKSLMPAFPDLHLVDVDVRDSEFLLKIGR